MKKLLAIMLSLTMVFSCLIFTACDNSADYKGDFSKEMTAEDLSGFIEKIDVGAAILEKSDKTVAFGMDGGLDIEGEIAIDTMSLKLKTENDLKVRANLSKEKAEDSYVMASFDTSAEATLKGSIPEIFAKEIEEGTKGLIQSFVESLMNKTAKEKASIILDKDGTVYLDGEASIDKALSSKTKIAVTIPQIKEAVQAEGVADGILEVLDGNQMIAMIKESAKQYPAQVFELVAQFADQFGIKIYFDGSNGYRFKIETTAKTTEFLKEQLGIEASDKFDLNASAYLIFDDVCRLKCAKVEIDTDFDFKLPTFDGLSATGKFKAKLELVANNSEISAPKNTDDYLKIEIPSFSDYE